MAEKNLNEALMDAVAYINLTAVEECLAKGADPNYTWHKDEDEPNGLMQPTTPLRMVMFRISDCDLTDKDLYAFAEIAKILLAHGADPKPAMEIAESRYGKYYPNDRTDPFMNVWNIVASALIKT